MDENKFSLPPIPAIARGAVLPHRIAHSISMAEIREEELAEMNTLNAVRHQATLETAENTRRTVEEAAKLRADLDALSVELWAERRHREEAERNAQEYTDRQDKASNRWARASFVVAALGIVIAVIALIRAW